MTPTGAFLARHPIEVQGLVVRPGDKVLVMVDGRAHPHVYAGCHEGGYWTNATFTTAEGVGPGPYALEDFRHPDVLTAFIKQVDVQE